MANKNNKTVYIVAGLLLLGGLAYLLVSGIAQGSTPTLTVSQALEQGQQGMAKVRLYGKVAEEGVERGADNLSLNFLVFDEANPGVVLPVAFTGAIPDTFAPGVEVILKGSLENGQFKAVQLTTKCPSKYEEKRDAQTS